MLIILGSFALSPIQVSSAWGYGFAVLRILRLREDGITRLSPWLYHLLALAAGLVVQSWLISIAGLAMLLRPFELAGILGGGCLLGTWFVLPASAGQPQAFTNCIFRFQRKPLLLLFCIPPILALLLESFVPDFSGDGYLYHISAPLFFVLEGGFVPQPHAFYYHYPLLMEMLYAPALAFGLEQAALHLNFWITLASALALYHLGSAVRDGMTGTIAAFLFLAAPSVLLWTPTSQPEPGGAFLMIMLVAALLQWRRESRCANRRSQLGYIALAGILAGGLVGCKILYALFVTGVAGLLAGTVIWDRFVSPKGRERIRESHANRKKSIGSMDSLILFPALCFLVYLPWFIKNWRFTGNPLFPMAVDLFPTDPRLAAVAEIFGSMHGFPHPASPLEWAREGLAGMAMLLGTQDAGFLAGMMATPIACFLAMRRRRDRFFWTMLLAFFLVVYHYGGILQTRWFLPAYAIMTLAAAFLARELGTGILSTTLPIFRKGLATIILLGLMGNWAMGYHERLSGPESTGVGYHRPWVGIVPGQKQAFLQTLPYFALAQVVNKMVPPNERVLVVQNPPYPQVRWYRRRFIQNGQGVLGGELGRRGKKIGQQGRKNGGRERRPAGKAISVDYIVMPFGEALGGQGPTSLEIEGGALGSEQGYSMYRLQRPIFVE